MLLFGGWRVLQRLSRVPLYGTYTVRHLTSKAYEPLRILFCGSDDFSIASLRALREEQLKCSDRIASIDVVCRPGKRVGRGLKQIREGTSSEAARSSRSPRDTNLLPVPIKAAAANLGLRVHEIDTFRGWTVLDGSMPHLRSATDLASRRNCATAQLTSSLLSHLGCSSLLEY